MSLHRLALLVALWDVARGAELATGGLRCLKATETTIDVSWDAVNGTDNYYIGLSADASSRPLALQTSASTEVTLIDLVPGTRYFLTLRSHPSEDNIVWGWRQPTAPVMCTTAAGRRDRPHALRRVGDAPSEQSIRVAWRHAEDAHDTEAAEVGVRRVGAAEWRWERTAATPGSDVEHEHEVQGLASGEWFEVSVRDARGRQSEPLRMRTAAAGALHTTAYRISEYQFDVDFLENHDGCADRLAMAAYVQNNGAMNESAMERYEGGSWSMDACLAALEHACPAERGNSFECMGCADRHRAAISQAHICGNFSDGDDRLGWGVHFYCGIGWPGSSFQRSPMTEYCVEHAAAPQTDPVPGGDGFAQYVSCNSDECDGVLLPTGNVPRDPTCICWVWDDRMISQEPRSRTLSVCSPYDKEPWVGANQCNCSMGKPGTEAALLPPDAPMANYVGRSRVYLPYYKYKKPLEDYPVSVLLGDNLSFPKKGACAEGDKLGDGGCLWKRMPTSRVLYGNDLLEAGWDSSEAWPGSGGSIERELAFTRANAAVFEVALERLERYVTKRCCGC
jgi:hypothetical protein